MTELTAEMIQRGRGGADPAEIARRRRLAQDVRAARERLTSSTGLQRAFDYELVRLFSQYRLGAFVPQIVLAAAIAAMACAFIAAQAAALWFLAVTGALAAMVMLSRRFLTQAAEDVDVAVWRRRFVLGEMLQGSAWALIVTVLLATDQPAARIFVLFVLLMVAAVTAMLSATIPIAVYAGLVPVAVALIGFFTPSREIDALTMALMGASAQLFFIFLAHRLYSSAVATLESRAEKDALFAELEEAKANSDEARRRAEEASFAKSRFLATMSHELRTPLNAILGFSEVMKNEIFGRHVAPAYKEYADDIHASGQHLLNLINEILDLSRIEAGRYELQEEAVPLAQVVEECQHMLALRARARSLTIREAIEDNLPRLWVDERALRQVVLNLLSNAIKFTPQGGEVTIKVGWTAAGGQYISIRDNGPGIPEEEIPVVMASFGRGSLAIKTAEQGSGLGLPIVKGLVELHGGGFTLKSKPREGTEAIVTFPPERVMDALAPVPSAQSTIPDERRRSAA
ncbi:HAMP domain-containing sensor histidine kinase [Chelatococcus sp. SYSU_G07232]|uniref:histidine kinase n=1 Tax=Chelatococcus albus TaxID=3047466 RepID=A0ABT7AK94_9HYPH|nr:HAMP domain-containing sensor histidine kinase [Chelatococcus sp. SYSU_G07232]MDJ1159796.1 HAMP domain-containing sensor histidine kinase [Chelatococcus sp. SYSU_G07232]